MANSGCESDAAATARHFIDTFAGYDYIVGPSGSCVLHLREHTHLHPPHPKEKEVLPRVVELCEFLHDVLKIKSCPPNSLIKSGCTKAATANGGCAWRNLRSW